MTPEQETQAALAAQAKLEQYAKVLAEAKVSEAKQVAAELKAMGHEQAAKQTLKDAGVHVPRKYEHHQPPKKKK